MASSQNNVDFIVDQLARAGDITAKKMFGEYGLYLYGKMFAMMCDDNLYIKPTTPGSAFFPDAPMASPYPGAKPCLLIPAEKWDDQEWLTQLAIITANALPLPVKKVKKAG